MTIYTTTTAGSFSFTTTIVIFAPPPCPHPQVDLCCDAEREEVCFICRQCEKTVALSRAQIAGDATGEATRGVLAAAFGERFRTTRFPWERLYACHAVGFPVPTSVIWASQVERAIRHYCGRLVAWMWRYDAEIFADL